VGVDGNDQVLHLFYRSLSQSPKLHKLHKQKVKVTAARMGVVEGEVGVTEIGTTTIVTTIVTTEKK
jgi:hypothetical protein